MDGKLFDPERRFSQGRQGAIELAGVVRRGQLSTTPLTYFESIRSADEMPVVEDGMK